ncbi:hypothetical protein JFN87_25275, partial [Streptomyces bomunensis]|nr:hypothetical protein [Streptomyces montanisoli]
MRRTTTTTMLLLGAASLAATAVTGCVSVAPDTTHATSSRPDAAAAGRRSSGARPQVVQAPASEALSMVRPTAPATPAPRPAAPDRKSSRLVFSL